MPLTPTAQRWAVLVTALEQSNLTTRAFAARHAVNPSTLAWWRSRLRDTVREAAFVPVELVEPATLELPTLEVHVARTGATVTVPVGADLAWLRAVVEALS